MEISITLIDLSSLVISDVAAKRKVNSKVLSTTFMFVLLLTMTCNQRNGIQILYNIYYLPTSDVNVSNKYLINVVLGVNSKTPPSLHLQQQHKKGIWCKWKLVKNSWLKMIEIENQGKNNDSCIVTTNNSKIPWSKNATDVVLTGKQILISILLFETLGTSRVCNNDNEHVFLVFLRTCIWSVLLQIKWHIKGTFW